MRHGWDEGGWRALDAELETWHADGARASFWWRDDDGGRPHPGLPRLLSLAAKLELPLGLAVVPAWLTSELVAELQTAPQDVVVLQHGAAHVNHEREPQPGERKVRPAECGSARPAAIVLRDLMEGARVLRARLASRVLPVCVPPWNRIAPEVVAALPAAGYRGLSTFRARGAVEPAPGLLQTNCHADPILWRDGKRFAGAAATLDLLRAHLAARRLHGVDPGEATGLLTHHQDLEEPGWDFLEELLGRLRTHPAVSFPPLASLLVPRAALPAEG